MVLRGRVKTFNKDRGFGWVEVPGGHPDHFIHFRRRGTVELASGEAIYPIDQNEQQPQVDDWVVFNSIKLPDKEQPQASPWVFEEEARPVLEAVCRRVSSQFFECCRLLGLTQ